MNFPRNLDSSVEPSRNRVGGMRTAIGLFGAPIAWLAQFSLSEPLAAQACYPNQTPLSAPVWGSLTAMLAAISLACFAAALVSGFIAWRSWRQAEGKAAGENRNRFLAKLSLMSSFIFIVAVIFNSFAVLLVSPCGSWF